MNTIVSKYVYDGNVLRGKFTVEERADGMFLSTMWIPDWGSEVDREINEFETAPAAEIDMLYSMLELLSEYAHLTARDKPKGQAPTYEVQR